MADNGNPGARDPLVTIVVPVFNRAKYLRESLDSIVAQTYPNLEILVMDDASTDESPGIIASYGDRLTRFRQPRNRGQFPNVDDGIAKARGKYVAVYHSDDVYEPEIVARQAAYLGRHPEVGAVFCQDILLDGASREVGRISLPPEIEAGRPLDYPTVLNTLLKYKNAFLRTPSSMVRAEVYAEAGPYRGEEFGIAADLEMWVRIARRHPVAVLPDYLFRCRFGHENLSKEYARLRTEEERYFTVMDHYLDAGDRRHATAEALADHEAHRAQDRLMRSVNLYILGRRGEARALLGQVRPGRILGSRRIQRWRLLVLFMLLAGLVRLPRLTFMAGMFYRHWHGGGELPNSS